MNYKAPFWFEAKQGNDWGDCALEYAQFSKRIGFYRDITQELLKLAHADTTNLLDFGCGDGRFTRIFLEKFRSAHSEMITVYLVDKFAEMLSLTMDLSAPNTEFVRVCDTEKLENLPSRAIGQIDTIACNSSFHLCRDIDLFIKRASEFLRPGGCLIANIPDQDYLFNDGWHSKFLCEANKLFGDFAGDPPRSSRYSESILRDLAYNNNFQIDITHATFLVTWEDFITFYSIPFMGARRMSNTNQEARLKYLRRLPPKFDQIDYRWIFLRMEKPQ